MERKTGEIFEFNSEWYQCVEQPEKYDKTVCNLCDFHGIGNCELDRCSGTYRSDKKNVIFKKLEKVGEPIIVIGRTFQKFTNSNSCVGCVFCNENNGCDKCCYMDEPCLDNEIWIEIKQRKEDMEENKLNLKPFDIQKAREGKPVCTRDGRKARIIFFDSTLENYPLVVLVGDYPYSYTAEGKFYKDSESSSDLMMLPEKKEGWVNIYRTQIYTTLEKAEKAYRIAGDDNYLETIKVEWEE